MSIGPILCKIGSKIASWTSFKPNTARIYCKRVISKLQKNKNISFTKIGERTFQVVLLMGVGFFVIDQLDALDHRQYMNDELIHVEPDHSLNVERLLTASLYRDVNVVFRYQDIDRDLAAKEDAKDEALRAFEEQLYSMVEDHPIEDMVPFIAVQDRRVAALIVGIAKKESNWGKRSPSKGGETCYNYWGYKGGGSRGHALGYGCFEGPEEAIDIVGGRIHELAVDAHRETPQKMIIWKCGSSCAGHDPGSVKKWISDVDIYYSRLVAYK